MNQGKYKSVSIKILESVTWITSLFTTVLMLLPNLNPARVTGLINRTMSLFTSAVSYDRLTSEALRAIRQGWVNESDFMIIFISSIIVALGILSAIVGSGFLLGNLKYKRLSHKMTLIGSAVSFVGLFGFVWAYFGMSQTSFPERVQPQFSQGFYYLAFSLVVIVLTSLVLLLIQEKVPEDMKYKMKRGNQLLLMFLPFAVLIFAFSYLPLWGWRYAFFDYSPGTQLSWDNFVGFRWFAFLINNPANRDRIGQVMINTLAMSGLGLITSWLPMMFAVFLAEITSTKFKRFVQVFTTIPNFISWVIVYALALAMFATDGFLNDFLMSIGWIEQPTNHLMGDENTWIKMWAWGTWKGLGWSAIIYIASISSIDPVLYEAATVDGAGRFQKMRYITIPSLLSTYFVLLVLSVASILSNGMDQYLVFQNPTNTESITVLDLYVFELGINNGNIPLSTLIGMLKSIISIVLLFSVNKLSKLFREESVF